VNDGDFFTEFVACQYLLARLFWL